MPPIDPVLLSEARVFAAHLIFFGVHMTQRLGLPPVPYVVAVATASNIGSVATITGNPQNMLIGSMSGIVRSPLRSRTLSATCLRSCC
jgi:hypothetical protein